MRDDIYYTDVVSDIVTLEERNLIYEYTIDLYRDINSGGTVKNKDPEIVRYFEIILKGLKKLSKRQILPDATYASVSFDTPIEYNPEIFRSSSVDASVTYRFYSEDSKFVKFISPVGAFISSLSNVMTESEFLLLPNEKYTIIHKDYVGYNSNISRVVYMHDSKLRRDKDIYTKNDKWKLNSEWRLANYNSVVSIIINNVKAMSKEDVLKHFHIFVRPDLMYNSVPMYLATHVCQSEGNRIFNRIFDEFSGTEYLNKLINYTSVSGETLMSVAIKANNFFIVDKILPFVDWNNFDMEGKSYPILFYIYDMHKYISDDVLEKHKKLLDIPDIFGRNFHFYNPTREMDLELVDEQGLTPLNYRLMNNLPVNFEFMKPIVNKKSKGYLPMTIFSDFSTMKSLMDNGADIIADDYGNNPIFHAAMMCPTCYSYLVDMGYALSKNEKTNYSAIMLFIFGFMSTTSSFDSKQRKILNNIDKYETKVYVFK